MVFSRQRRRPLMVILTLSPRETFRAVYGPGPRAVAVVEPGVPRPHPSL